MRDKKDAGNVDVQLYLEDFEKLQFKLEYLDAKTLNSENVHHNEKLLKESPTISGSLQDVNNFREWGVLFVAHALLVLGESEAQAEINELQAKLDKLIMMKNKHSILTGLFQKEGFMNALTDTNHITESANTFAAIANKPQNEPESPEVASPMQADPTLNQNKD